jgi:hypothetical protein
MASHQRSVRSRPPADRAGFGGTPARSPHRRARIRRRDAVRGTSAGPRCRRPPRRWCSRRDSALIPGLNPRCSRSRSVRRRRPRRP